GCRRSAGSRPAATRRRRCAVASPGRAGLPPDGDTVVAEQAEIAAAAGCAPADVSRMMRDLEKAGAVTCRRPGRLVIYEVNPMLGSPLAGAARDKAQAEAPRLQSGE
ncbi:MAG: helix-turn-helix domain-containing protein, partial [Geminicoccaceae bacterium]